MENTANTTANTEKTENTANTTLPSPPVPCADCGSPSVCRFKQGDRVCRKCYARRWKGRKTFQTALARMERWFLENPEEILAEHHTCCCGPDGCDGPMMLRFDCWDGNAVRDGLMLDDAAMYLVENFSPDHYVWTCMEHAGLLVPETEVDVLAARIRWLEFLLGRR